MQSEDQSLSDVAKKNGTSPMKVYEVMVIHTIKEPVEAKKEETDGPSQHTDTKAKQKQGSPQTQLTYTAEALEERLAGKGIGKKTLDEISAELGIKTEEALQRLKKQGIEATKDQTLKEIANSYNTTPIM